MKEILHRAKTISGQWVEGYYAEIDNCSVLFVNEKPLHVDPETVGDYTSLKDKNGRKIFEGDIIVVSNKSYKPKGQVVWSNHTAKWLIAFEGSSGIELGTWSTKLYEVIGNIYENSDLLK